MYGKIFINYRRGDDPGFTQALYMRLEDEFGVERLFMDVEGHIRPGDDFVQVLDAQVAQSDVVLAVVGPRWTELMAARAGDKDDFVAIEIKSALDREKRVIPVLVGGALMPRADALPAGIQSLARRNAVGLRPERFKADCQGLIAALKQQLAAAEHERAARTETERLKAETARREAEEQAANRAKATEERARVQASAGLSADEIRKAEELANWEFIKDKADIAELRDHLARFPRGSTERYALERAATLVWNAIGHPDQGAVFNNSSALEDFLREFPNAREAGEARAALRLIRDSEAARIAEEQLRLQETEAWGAVAAGTDQARIKAFLKEWPSGVHAEAANARLKELKGAGRFNRRSLLKGIGYGVGGTAVAGIGAHVTLTPGMPVWQLIHDQSLRTLEGHKGKVEALAITPDGSHVVSGSADNTLKVWDLATGRTVRTMGWHKVTALAITPDGRHAISGADSGTLKIWEIGSGKELQTLKGHTGAIRAVAVTPDGQRIISGSDDSTLKLWDIAAGRELRSLTGHTKVVSAVAIMPSGNLAISGSYGDGNLKLWDINTGKKLRDIEAHKGGSIIGISVSRDGRKAISFDISSFEVRETRSWSVDKNWNHHINPLCFSTAPNGIYTAAGGLDHLITFWDNENGKVLKTRVGHLSAVSSLAITPNGRFAVSGSWDDTLKVWDISKL